MLRWIEALIIGLLLVSGAANATEVFTTYYHNDLLGSPVAATDESGNILWREHFRPYGERQDTPAYPGYGSVGYTGHVQSQSSELVYMGARHYDPLIGRFLSVDPASLSLDSPGSINRFVYSENGPYKYTDPDGREIVSVNSSDNRTIEAMINSIASGHFGFSKNGRLQLLNGEANENGSSYYTRRLVGGINSRDRISISVGDSVFLPDVGARSVGDFFGGGVTVGPIKGGEQSITVSSYGTAVASAGGGYIPFSQSESLMHELVGHAIPRLIGGGLGDGVKNENKVRQQIPGFTLRAPSMFRDPE